MTHHHNPNLAANVTYTGQQILMPMIKQLTLWGYFSSEIGATQALRYVAIPGKYEGCIPYKKGDKAWAT